MFKKLSRDMDDMKQTQIKLERRKQQLRGKLHWMRSSADQISQTKRLMNLKTQQQKQTKIKHKKNF